MTVHDLRRRSKPTKERLLADQSDHATVNGKPWTDYNKDKETITFKGLTGQVAVTAQY